MIKKYFYNSIFLLFAFNSVIFGQDNKNVKKSEYENETGQETYKPKFQAGMIADSGGMVNYPVVGGNSNYGVISKNALVKGDNAQIVKNEKKNKQDEENKKELGQKIDLESDKSKENENEKKLEKKEIEKKVEELNNSIQAKSSESAETRIIDSKNDSKKPQENQSVSNIDLINKYSGSQKVVNKLPDSVRYSAEKKPKIKYKIKKKQFEALDMPKMKINKRNNYKIQLLPPNISQRKYINGVNSHLAPVEFEFEYQSMLFKYIQTRENSVIRSLINKISDINVVDQDGNSLLMHALYYNNYEAMMILINNGIDIDMTNDFGYNALHHSCYTANMNAIIILIESGAWINCPDHYGNTPIFYAIMNGNKEILKYLIEKGANLDIVNEEGLNIVDFSLYSKNKEILKYLLKKGVIKIKEREDIDINNWKNGIQYNQKSS